MRRIVIDASVLAEYLLRTDRGLELEGALVEFEHDLHAPALCDIEVLAVLRRGLLEGRLDEARANEALEDLRDLPLARHGHQGLLGRVLSLGRNFSAYDATYVALAEDLDAELWTDDRRLAGAVAEHTRARLFA